MACLWITPVENGQYETSICRDGANKIVIVTQTYLTDEQVGELFWIFSAMARSGKTLSDALTKLEELRNDN